MKHIFRRKSTLILILITLFALAIRLYRFEDLAVFIADQAIESGEVAKMVRGNLTLLGTKVSVSDFYNGPIVFYLMFPFYFLLNNNPIAGTIFQTTLNVLTIPLIYLIGIRIHKIVGLLSAFLIAISALLVDFSRAAFNAYPAFFFSTLSIYLMILNTEKFSRLKSIVLGITLGFVIQMHYLNISLWLAALIIPIVFGKLYKIKINYYLTLIVGIVIGFSPFIAFEAKHTFLNTHRIIQYLTTSIQTTERTFDAFTYWPILVSKLLFAHEDLAAFFALGIIVYSLGKSFWDKKPLPDTIKILLIVFASVFFVSLLYGRPLLEHYVIPSYIPLIVLFSVGILTLFGHKLKTLLFVSLLLTLINYTFWNLSQIMNPLQDGITIKKAAQIAKIIESDCPNCNYNVMMLAQKDNRAMPIRYFLNLTNNPPQSVENYGKIKVLYALIPKSITIENITTWEYQEFGSHTPAKSWPIEPHFILYKLQK